MQTFVGDGHRQILLSLLRRIDRVAHGDVTVPRIVILEGAAGLGKSRLLRELYREMRATRDPASYWPELEEPETGTGAARDPLPGRKRIGPPVEGFVWPANTLPAFAWWQLQCERMQNGGLIDVAAQARSQIAAHIVPLTLAWTEAASAAERVVSKRSALGAAAREALREGGLEAATRVLSGFDVVIPGLGLAASWVLRGIGGARERSNERRDAAADIDLGQRSVADRRSVSADLAAILVSATHRDLPAVVVIEDVHLMSEGLADLLDLLSRPDPNRPLIVVGTAWPRTESASPYSEWLSSASADGRIDLEQVPYLKESDLIQMIRAYAPHTEESTALKAAQLFANPLSLEVFLSLRRVRERIATNAGSLPEDVLSLRSPKLKALYREQFWELPEQLQIGLCAAAATLPKSTLHVWPFVADLVAEAARRCPELPADAAEVSAAIQRTAAEGVWLVQDGVAESFREALQAQIAREYYEESFAAEGSHNLSDAISAVLEERIDRMRGSGFIVDADQEAAVVCRWFLEIVAADCNSPARLVASFLVAGDLATAYQYSDAVNVLGPALDTFSYDHPDLLTIRAAYAWWIGEMGRPAEAIELYDRLILAQRILLGSDDDPIIVRLLGNRASRLASSGRNVEAVMAYREIIQLAGSQPGEKSLDYLTARLNLGILLGQAGMVQEGLESTMALINDLVPQVGSDHGLVLSAVHNLAQLLESSGNFDEAIETYRRVLLWREAKSGSEDPTTLLTRKNLATAFLSAGRIAEAADTFETLHDDVVRVVGRDHPLTLAVRNDLGGLALKSGRIEDGVRILESVLNDRIRVLGDSHPDTFTTRTQLALALQDADRPEESLSSTVRLLEDQSAALGWIHPSTLTTRNNLAAALARLGQFEQAVNTYEELVGDLMASLGAQDPRVHQTRCGMAGALFDLGRQEEAIALYQDVLEQQIQIFGPGHLDVQITRHNLDFDLARMERGGTPESN